MPALGLPMVGRVMRSFPQTIVDELLVVVSPGDRLIADYLQGAADWPGAIQIIYQHEALGMAHALRQAAPFLHGPFFLSACDSLLSETSWRALFSAVEPSGFRAGALAAQEQPAAQASKSAVLSLKESWVQRIVEKPGPVSGSRVWVSLPHYLLPHSLLEHLGLVSLSERGELELQDAIQAFIDGGGQMRGVPVPGRLQLTRPQDLLRLHRTLMRQEGAGQFQELPAGKRVRKWPVYVEPGAQLGRDLVLGPDVFVERGAVIGDGADLADAVILKGGVVMPGARVAGAVIGPAGQFAADDEGR